MCIKNHREFVCCINSVVLQKRHNETLEKFNEKHCKIMFKLLMSMISRFFLKRIAALFTRFFERIRMNYRLHGGLDGSIFGIRKLSASGLKAQSLLI